MTTKLDTLKAMIWHVEGDILVAQEHLPSAEAAAEERPHPERIRRAQNYKAFLIRLYEHRDHLYDMLIDLMETGTGKEAFRQKKGDYDLDHPLPNRIMQAEY